jgi:hypothetical protein
MLAAIERREGTGVRVGAFRAGDVVEAEPEPTRVEENAERRVE